VARHRSVIGGLGNAVDGLRWCANLTLSWAVLEAMPGAAELAAQADDNLRVLRNVAMLEDFAPALDDTHFTTGSDLARMERKLDLLLELMQHRVGAEVARPPTTAVSLAGDGIEWCGDVMPAPGALVCTSFHLSAAYPGPIRLIGEVAGARAGDASGDGEGSCDRVRVDFRGHGEEVRDAIDKHVFRQHRREIAAQRRGT
jgi:hypothetical protein